MLCDIHYDVQILLSNTIKNALSPNDRAYESAHLKRKKAFSQRNNCVATKKLELFCYDLLLL